MGEGGLGAGQEACQVGLHLALVAASPALHGAAGCWVPQFEHQSEGLDLSGTNSNVANRASSRKPDAPAAKKPCAGLCRYLEQRPLGVIHGGWGLVETKARQAWANMGRAGSSPEEAPGLLGSHVLCIPVPGLRPCHPPAHRWLLS